MNKDGTSGCIVGVASGTPDGGVAVLRLSGGACAQVGESLLGQLPSPRVASLRTVRDATGNPLDQALVLWMPGPRSFTGEDVLELHVHGGQLNVRQLVECCMAAGARGAQPGEFSRRAFLNGQLSLDQVEALPGILCAGSSLELERSRRLLRGELGERVDEMARRLFTLRVEIEAHLDFPEDVDRGDTDRWLGEMDCVASSLREWVKNQEEQRDRAGRCRLVIAGPPNAGKSSLFNALLNRKRSIVSKEAGTTRDFVESSLSWKDLSFDLVDTAGIRGEAQSIEAEGIELGKREIDQADWVIWVEPGGNDSGQQWEESGRPANWVKVSSKMDELGVPEGWLGVSVAPGFEQTVVDLRAALEAKIRSWAMAGSSDWIGLKRHADCVAAALHELEVGRSEVDRGDPQLEIVAFHLGAASQSLGAVRGRDRMAPVGESVLNAIFSSFCIGK